MDLMRIQGIGRMDNEVHPDEIGKRHAFRIIRGKSKSAGELCYTRRKVQRST
jgi:hypothetical protein